MRMLVLLLSLLGACSMDGGGSCRLEKLGDLPVDIVGNVPVVTMQINGQPAHMVVDTGSNSTVLTRVAARRLGIAEGTERRQIFGAGGSVSGIVAPLGPASLGPVPVEGVTALLTDAPAPPLDGLLGIDLLVRYELEFDLPHRRIGLYAARSCATAGPPWPATPLPVAQQAGSGHLFLPVQLDGQPLRGVLDSGASLTTISLQAAGDQGINRRKLQTLPGIRGQAVNASGFVARGVRFRSMQIGADVIERPAVLVGDLPAFAGDVLVGSDYMGSRLMWISFRLGRAFVARTG